MIPLTYIALYRKWRPRTFEDVIGQEHITQTLKNQIKNNNIAHAYLFCGTRGTGKTSTAKIFARAVNCANPVDLNPCNQCDTCTGIQQETVMDVIEIDAASNNGVDDIRELRENVKYPPTKGKYKVYIIDEVHMLSTGAFNALLKTLEEPPHFVIFILATTEPHKIPATILSRCQRFDFKRVKEEEMVKLLADICEKTGIQAESSALRLITRNADGAMRDALSLLDQCIAYCVDGITYDDVIGVLGTVSDEFIFSLVNAVIEGNSREAMENIEALIGAGKDIQQFIKDLIRHYRNLLMTKASQNVEGIINLSRENIERLKEQGEKTDTSAVIRAIHILSEVEVNAKWSSQPRILLEVAVLKLCQPMLDPSIDGLLERIAALEKKLQHGFVRSEVEKRAEEEEKPIEISTKKVEEKQPQPMPRPPASGKSISLEKIEKLWSDILKEIKKRKISAHAVLMEGKPATVDRNTLLIVFKEGFGFHKEAAGNSPNKEFIEGVLEEILGETVYIKCIMEDEAPQLSEAGKEISIAEEDLEVQKIIEIFGEDLVEIIEE